MNGVWEEIQRGRVAERATRRERDAAYRDTTPLFCTCRLPLPARPRFHRSIMDAVGAAECGRCGRIPENQLQPTPRRT